MKRNGRKTEVNPRRERAELAKNSLGSWVVAVVADDVGGDPCPSRPVLHRPREVLEAAGGDCQEFENEAVGVDQEDDDSEVLNMWRGQGGAEGWKKREELAPELARGCVGTTASDECEFASASSERGGGRSRQCCSCQAL